MKYIISYDLGTGGTKASLFNSELESVASSFIDCKTFYSKSGYHEQRPCDWWKSVVESTKLLLTQTKVKSEDIVSLAVSGHSLAAVPISNEGELLCEYVPIWSDSRAGEQAKRFFKKIDEKSWYMDTGNGFPPPLYSVFKIMWLKDNYPEIYEKTEKFIGTKDYINFRLTGKLCTDRSYASGSGVYSLENEKYRDDYINAAEIDKSKLPDIFQSSDVIGYISEEAAELTGLSKETKVCAGGVDNACMALGAGCTEDGDTYTSLGTSAWIAVSGGKPIVDYNIRPYVFAHCLPGKYVSATCIFSAGNSFRWLKQILYDEDKREDIYKLMDELAEKSPCGANGCIFVPTMAGGSGLDKSPNAKGCFAGLELRHTRSDLIRASLEGICMHLRIALDLLEKNTEISKDMLIVGGGGKSKFWRQLFADIYEKNIIETNVGQDAGSLGAALCAALGAKIINDYSEVKKVHKIKDRKIPIKENSEIYRKILPIFEKIADMQSEIGDLLSK